MDLKRGLFLEFTELVSMNEPFRLAVFLYFEEMTESEERWRRTIGLEVMAGTGELLKISLFLCFLDESNNFVLYHFCPRLFYNFVLL